MIWPWHWLAWWRERRIVNDLSKAWDIDPILIIYLRRKERPWEWENRAFPPYQEKVDAK